jgi:hypothetical protein
MTDKGSMTRHETPFRVDTAALRRYDLAVAKARRELEEEAAIDSAQAAVNFNARMQAAYNRFMLRAARLARHDKCCH